MIVVNKKQMNDIDRAMTDTYGLPSLLLMEHAAMAVADVVCGRFGTAGSCLVFAGSGNNGGDAFAVARILVSRGWIVDVVCPGDADRLGCDSAAMFSGIAKFIEDGEINLFKTLDLVEAGRIEYDLYIDGLFGTGCSRPIEGDAGVLIDWINGSGMEVVSIDIPSGIRADDGTICGRAVMADLTVTLGLPKPGNLLYPGAAFNGELICRDIGLYDECIERAGYDMEILEEEILLDIPIRVDHSHKYSYGRVLAIAGSSDMPGAAALSAHAAYKTGCGLVEVFTEDGGKGAVLAQVPEAVVTGYEKDGQMDVLKAKLEGSIERADAILIGPGCGVDAYTETMLEIVLAQKKAPVIVDADGLTVLSKRRDLLASKQAETILTPHYGEMARLAGTTSAAIEEGAVHHARTFSMEHDVVTVLKSDRTLIGLPDGFVFINIGGSHSLATAGSGDVMAGMAVSLLGQGCTLNDAAKLAVYCHARCGVLAEELNGGRGVIARDIIDLIPSAMEVGQ